MGKRRGARLRSSAQSESHSTAKPLTPPNLFVPDWQHKRPQPPSPSFPLFQGFPPSSSRPVPSKTCSWCLTTTNTQCLYNVFWFLSSHRLTRLARKLPPLSSSPLHLHKPHLAPNTHKKEKQAPRTSHLHTAICQNQRHLLPLGGCTRTSTSGLCSFVHSMSTSSYVVVLLISTSSACELS